MPSPALQHNELQLSIEPDLSQIGRLLEGTSLFLTAQGMSDRLRRRAMLAIEEIAANAIMHGGAADQGPIQITLSAGTDMLVATLCYRGVAFDPRHHTAAERAPEAAPGGQGLYLVQHYADGIEYDHEAGRNLVRLAFCRNAL